MPGGLFFSLGAFLLRGKVIETNGGKKITRSNPSFRVAVSDLVSVNRELFGIPIPQTQVTTCSILGIGMPTEAGRFGRRM